MRLRRLARRYGVDISTIDIVTRIDLTRSGKFRPIFSQTLPRQSINSLRCLHRIQFTFRSVAAIAMLSAF
jgi:hypothetical protein